MIKIIETKKSLNIHLLSSIETQVKRFSWKEIGAVKYSYHDDGENSLSITIFSSQELKTILDGETPSSLEALDDAINNYFYYGYTSYNNTIEAYEEDDDNILEIILKLVDVCTKRNIPLIQPDENDSQFAKFIDWHKWNEAINWWKDDVVFRAFSKN